MRKARTHSHMYGTGIRVRPDGSIIKHSKGRNGTGIRVLSGQRALDAIERSRRKPE